MMTPSGVLILLMICVGGTFGAPDNRGTEFIIGFMENYQTSFNLELFVTTSRTTVVNVKVTAPRFPSANLNQQFTVSNGQVKQITFTNTLRLIQTEKSSKAVLVEADDEIVIYGVNKEAYSNDAFLGLPTDVLGKEYYATCYYPPTRNTEILVVGVEDNTAVTFKLSDHSRVSFSYGGRTYAPSDTLNINLNRYDTFQIATYGDLTGTKISADKKISVFSGNRKTNIGSGGSQDHLVEHLTPVDSWGKNFATVPIPGRTTGDYFRFIASDDNTVVRVNGQISGSSYTDSFTISKAGQFVQKHYSSKLYASMTADKPVLLVQYVLSQQSGNEPSDPAMMIIPPVEQYGADYSFATPKYSRGSYINYFMFVVKKAEKDGLIFDGSLVTGVTFNDIPGTDYVGGYLNIAEGSHTVRHQSTISVFGGFLFGRANAESYAFTTGMRMAPINTVCVPTTSVTGDGLDNDCDGLIDEELCIPSNNRKDDDGDGRIDEDCAKPPPVDGEWASWQSWGSCSVTCSSSSTAATGSWTRTRTCTNPAPAYDGKQCVGSGTGTGSCSITTRCPINGGLSSWSAWGSCSVTCGGGTKISTRSCTNPAPQYNGAACTGSTSKSTGCNTNPCPIDGGWASWTSWGTCTVTCGGGSQDRSRTCTNPTPQHGGANCVGSGSSTQVCNTQLCVIDGEWATWGAWGTCSLTCGGGKHSRSRTCSNPYPQNGGLDCSGASSNFGDCNTNACPTPSSGAYVQLCPQGWFTCQSGAVSCIDTSFVCDCASDCEDGSDEMSTYASCNPALLSACPNSFAKTTVSVVCLFIGFVISVFIKAL